MLATASPYYSTAVAAANQYGVPTNLFLAQITQESSWNPFARNGNAIGLGQFMPKTAASLGVNPYDPVSSLYGAAKYDAQLYSQYGSWQTALQKYGTTANGDGSSVNALAAQADKKTFWQDPLNYDFGPALDSMFNQIPVIGDANKALGSTADPNSGISSVISGAGSLLSILTDLPRLFTIIVGLICLGAGLFMLGNQPVRQLVSKVTSAVK